MVLCSDRSAVASSVALVINQRLVRRLCRDCSGKGCESCLQTGYHGRLPVVEYLRVTDSMRRHIGACELDSLVAKPSLAGEAQNLLTAGLTNEAEVQRVFGPSFT
jgi:type II secretory ATPase GspE/PulE/Tfp pilus assembly ATPase PilB-like protein